MHPTKFDGYYVTEEGKIFRDSNKNFDGKKCLEKVEVKEFLRGGGGENKRQYKSINISIRNDVGKTVKQIKYYSHRLIAETLIPNPKEFKEVDHINMDKNNNSVTNLRWVNRSENMEWSAKSFKITDTKTGKIYTGKNNNQWIRENWEWISKRTKMNKVNFTKNLNYRKNVCKFILEKF